MSDSRKYYYLKLKEGFFDSEEMKILESQKNGIKYQNLYLKMCLLSLKADGRLMFKDLLPYDIEMLSTILRVDIDTVKTGIEIFSKLRLVDVLENGEMYMSDIQSLIGHGSSEAERKAEYRRRIEQDKVGTLSGLLPPEIEIKTEIEKEIDINTAADKRPRIDSRDVETVYAAYPSHCHVTNRPTGKGVKNKQKIKALLKNGQTVEGLLALIKLYLDGCRKSNTYLKNFSTFLNQLPDVNELKKKAEQKKAVTADDIRKFMEGQG